MTKSSVNFIKINDAKSNNETEEVKIIDLKITPLDSNTNNLCMIDENSKTFCVGCVNGLGILSGKNMELLLFVEFENTIKNVDVYFDKSIILFSHFEKNTVNVPGQNIYNFVQLIKTNDDNKNYDYKNKKVIKKSSDRLDDDINVMKSVKDGIIVIGDKKGNLQLWH